MRRREFIKALAGSAAPWPLIVRAQQSIPVVGFLSSRSPGESAQLVTAFREGLKEAGYLDSKDVHISFRWAEGRYDRLPQLAAELVEAQVAVIASVGGSITALAAKSATRTIPIVAIASDPLKHGLVASFNRPGGNVTVVSPSNTQLSAKRREILRELVPTANVIGVLVNPQYPDSVLQLQDTVDAASALGQQIHVVNASKERDIDTAFANLVENRIGALLVALDPFLDTRREQIVAQAAHYAVPTIYGQREFSVAGGLISYASNFSEAYRQAGVYAGRILKGEKPAVLPVMQPTKFELVINLKTARALGLAVPPSLLARADEVIE